MPKTSISVKLKNSEGTNIINVPAILQDEIIKYRENHETTVKFNYDKNELERENKELQIIYNFDENKKTIGKIYLKELSNTLEIEIKTKRIKRKDHNIEIEFEVEDNEFLYQIEVTK